MSARKIGKSWYADVTWSGKRYRKRSPWNTKQGARELEQLMVKTLVRDGNLDALDPKKLEDQREVDVPTFAEFAETWLTRCVLAESKYSVWREDRNVLNAHLLPRLGSKRLDEVSSSELTALGSDLLLSGRKAKTVNNIFSVLRRCLKRAVQMTPLELAPTVPWYKAEEADWHYLSDEEVDRLIAASPPGFWRTLVMTSAYTGLRTNELMGLEWRSIDLERGLISVSSGIVRGQRTQSPKSRKPRKVPIGPRLRSALASLERTSPLVFPMHGVAWPDRAARVELRRISDAAGVVPHATFQILRHTYATRAVSRGVHIDALQKIMGHADIQTTMRYAHFADERLHDAALRVEAPPREPGQYTGKNGQDCGRGARQRSSAPPKKWLNKSKNGALAPSSPVVGMTGLEPES